MSFGSNFCEISNINSDIISKISGSGTVASLATIHFVFIWANLNSWYFKQIFTSSQDSIKKQTKTKLTRLIIISGKKQFQLLFVMIHLNFILSKWFTNSKSWSMPRCEFTNLLLQFLSTSSIYLIVWEFHWG